MLVHWEQWTFSLLTTRINQAIQSVSPLITLNIIIAQIFVPYALNIGNYDPEP